MKPLTSFRIQAGGDTLRVYVWKDRAEMRDVEARWNRERLLPRFKNRKPERCRGCFIAGRHFRRRYRLPRFLGELHFSGEHLEGWLVAHEAFHAVSAYARKYQTRRSRDPEEVLAELAGRIFKGVARQLRARGFRSVA